MREFFQNRAFLLNYSLEHPGGDGLAGEEQVLGKTDYDLSPAFLADQFRLDDEQVLAGNRVVNRIERVGEDEGSADWNVTSKIPVLDSKGAIIGAAEITRALNKDELPGGTISGFEPVLAYRSTTTSARFPTSNWLLRRRCRCGPSSGSFWPTFI